MLKRILIAAIVSLAPLSAVADEQLASDWGHEAALLYSQTVSAMRSDQISVEYEDRLARFAVNSTRLSVWIESDGGPSDLACIFRGMSEEAELQLEELNAEASRQAALRRLATLFYDAETMALAAIHASETVSGYNELQHSMSCPADRVVAYQYLTEQP